MKNRQTFVKGLEKQKWVENFLLGQPVVNIEDSYCGVESIRRLYQQYSNIGKCLHHEKDSMHRNNDVICALKTALILRKIILSNSNSFK